MFQLFEFHYKLLWLWMPPPIICRDYNYTNDPNVNLLFIFPPPPNYKTPAPELNYKPPSKTKPPAADPKYELLLVVCCLFYSKERENAAIATASGMQRERNCSYYDNFATTTGSGAQRAKNCSYYDRFRCSEREKLQLQRPLQLCRKRETAATATASAVQTKRNCN